MNRASRRQQRKHHRTKGRTTPGSTSFASGTLAAGAQYHQAGRLADAEAQYRKVLEANPTQPAANHLLGLICHQTGRNDDAADLIRVSIAGDARNSTYHKNLGVILQKLGQVTEAAIAFRRAGEIDPSNFDVQLGLGDTLWAGGELEAAAAAYRRAIAIKRSCVETHCKLGNVLQAQEQFEEAIDAYHAALRIRPESVEVRSNLGCALRELNRLDEALAVLRSAIELKPDHAGAHSNLGVVLSAMGDLDAAVTAYGRALECDPDHVNALGSLGNALVRLGQLEKAVAACQRAIELKPEFAGAHNNLGTALMALARNEDAEASFRRALELDPNDAKAHLNLSTILLSDGRFDEGWDHYEWRHRTKELAPQQREFSQPDWDGSDLTGQSILLYSDQGIGDAIQFVRYSAMVAARGGRVILECQESLVPLFRDSNMASIVVALGSPLPIFETYCALASLPRLCGSTPDVIHTDGPYLKVDPKKEAVWRERLGSVSGCKVGLVWAGNAAYINDRNRSIDSLSQLGPLLRTPGTSFFSLQVGERSKDLAEHSEGRIEDLTSDIANFADTAAAIRCLDLVISVDTATAHLAGALGQPVWILLPFVPDWRWGRERDDTPWYPTMRLFRQARQGDWPEVMERVTAALRKQPPNGSLKR